MSVTQALTFDQKRQLCEFKEKAPASTQSQLAQHAKEKFGVTPSLTAMYRMLRAKDKWLSIKKNVPTKRQRPPKWPGLEAALDTWLDQMHGEGTMISGAAIIEKAKELASELKISDFGGSAGWLGKFKARRMIQMSYGEPSAHAGVPFTKEALLSLIEEQGFEPQDVFNMDETGLQYGAQPRKFLAKEVEVGGKVFKDRITVGLTANSDGTEHLKPIVIHKAETPLCFPKNFDLNAMVDYYVNPKDRMNSEIFEHWARSLNREMGRQERRILLIVDNSPSHKIVGLAPQHLDGFETIPMDHVLILVLPANTTSVVQPPAAGFIAAWKISYRSKFIRWQLKESQTAAQAANIMPLLHQAIEWSVEAWDEQKLSTFVDCWAKSSMVPSSGCSNHLSAASQPVSEILQAQIEDLGNLISELGHGVDAISAGDFIELPGEKQVEEELRMDDLVNVAMALTEDTGEHPIDFRDLKDCCPPTVSLFEAQQAADCLALFMRAHPETFSADSLLMYQQEIRDAVINMALPDSSGQHQRQRSITSFFSPAAK